jgi:glycosyltransferase involved in cell wall biosynthesis
MANDSYALITAAKNEKEYISQTLEAVVAQTLLPRVWVIVSDGSTDGTDEIVKRYAADHKFIRLIRRETDSARTFASQAAALNAAYESIKHGDFEFIGCLDADVSFDSTYYEKLIAKFHRDFGLGIASGQIVEAEAGQYRPRRGNVPHEVAGAVQFMRRDCYEDVRGFALLPWGGHDTVANAMARHKGWTVRTFNDLDVRHYRPTGTAGSTVRTSRIREGMQDYSIGYHFLYEFGKCLKRVSEPPFLIGSAFRLWGYMRAATQYQRMLPADFVRDLKRSQLQRLFHGVEK